MASACMLMGICLMLIGEPPATQCKPEPGWWGRLRPVGGLVVSFSVRLPT